MENSIQKFGLTDDTFIRYKKIGNGDPILLLHTFRNRLEYSDKISQLLKKNFTVYSIDLPGFGDSPINTQTSYTVDFFTHSIVDFIKKLKLKNVTIAGESIGAVLSASISNKIPKLVKKIFLLNPYDFDSFFGEGISRGNFFAKFILFHVSLPFVGNIFCSLENKFILKNIMHGGFFDSKKLSQDYLNLLCKSLKKKGYVYHFRNVLSNFQTWIECKNIYETVNHPTVLIYGEADWSTLEERSDSQNKLKLNSHHKLTECGHFSFLEQPKKVAQIINNLFDK